MMVISWLGSSGTDELSMGRRAHPYCCPINGDSLDSPYLRVSSPHTEVLWVGGGGSRSSGRASDHGVNSEWVEGAGSLHIKRRDWIDSPRLSDNTQEAEEVREDPCPPSYKEAGLDGFPLLLTIL